MYSFATAGHWLRASEENEAIELSENAETNGRQNLYSEYIKALAPASLTARKYLHAQNIEWDDMRNIDRNVSDNIKVEPI